jgi:2-alkyl-3-oxoalkanoate reductase
LLQRIWPEPIRKAPAKNQHDALQKLTLPIKRRSYPTTLVTGASGFIGSHLIKRLLRDSVPVRAFVRPNSYGLGLLKGMNTEIFHGDLFNLQALQQAVDGVETIFHVGAATHGDWETHRRSTVVGTRNVMEAALKANVKRVVHFSSLAVYCVIGISDGTVIGEDWPYEEKAEKLDPYTRAKVEAEKIVFGAHAEGGLAACVVRPGMVIGPRGQVFFPHMGYRFQDRIFVVFDSGDAILPLIYIDNLIGAVMHCANNHEAIGKTYNLVDDGSVTVLEYLRRFIEETKLPARIIKVPYFLPYCATGAYEIAAGLGFLKNGATSRLQLSWKHKSLHVKFSNARAKKDLSWSCEVSMDDALANTFRWYAETRR